MPRHSPCALLRFTFRSSEWFYSFCWFSFSDSLCSNKFYSFNLLKLLATCSFYPTSNWILTLRILFDVVVLWLLHHKHVVSSFLHYTCYSVFKIPTVLKSKLFKLWSLQANSRVLPFSKQISEESFLSPQICFEEWAQVDSNHRPHAYQACALTGWAMGPSLGGDEGNRTPDPLLAKQVLSQLSYTPIFFRACWLVFQDTFGFFTVRYLQNWTMQLRVFPLRVRTESFLNLNWSFESKFFVTLLGSP